MIQEMKMVETQMQVALSGNIYLEEVKEIKETFTSLINQGQKCFLIDLSQVDYIDSAGLGALVYIQKRTLKNGGRIKIKGLQGIVKELFELTRLTKVFEIQQ